MNLTEFHHDLRNTIETRAAIENDYKSASFMADVAERLASAGEIEDLTVVQFEGVGDRNRRLAVDGFDLGDADNSVTLAVLAFRDTDEISTLTMTEAKKALASLENFLIDAVGGAFTKGREESSASFQLADDLYRRGNNVTRYRLFLITDTKMSDRARSLPGTTVDGIPVEFHIWDVQRLHQVHASQQGREELDIDLTEWIPGGLRVLEISDTSSDFVTYLAAMPGKVVSDLYRRYGSKLLEANVRSFLSVRGKVNKGIRATLQTEPERFLAYNNGITATATGVEIRGGSSFLTRIRDLQIVNGGQTTASLFYIDRDEGNAVDLNRVFVQMKLVVVPPERALELVPNISRFANSQNRVSEADFFSNSAFHIRMEEISRRVLAPAKPGVHFHTKWFYERTRGQYVNEKSKLAAPDARKFVVTYPKNQLISKTDAAKYEVSWAMKPHLVSAGAQKNFVAFAAEVKTKWDSADSQFDEVFFRRLVAKSLLYNETRAMVSRSDWYSSGYLANVVTYALAKLAFEIGRQGQGLGLDFVRIWNAQTLSETLSRTILDISKLAFETLTDPRRRVANVTEWAKNEECWRVFQSVEYNLSDEFLEELISPIVF
jgi:hypothetical protein